MNNVTRKQLERLEGRLETLAASRDKLEAELAALAEANAILQKVIDALKHDIVALETADLIIAARRAPLSPP